MQTVEVLCLCAFNVLSFVIGAKIGQKTAKGEDIKGPKMNPMAIYNEHKEKEEVKREREKLNTILSNIERYDGTESGQEDVPR